MEIGLPSVEHVALGLRARVTCSTSGRHISMSHSLLPHSAYIGAKHSTGRAGEWVSQLQQQQQRAPFCVDRPPLINNRTIYRPSCRLLLD